MKLHKEGYTTVIFTFIVLSGFCLGLLLIAPDKVWLQAIIIAIPLITYLRIVYFFRVPKRAFQTVDHVVLSPADGKIVAIEEVFEGEYLKKNCIQVSVFMSPSNVHINWIPIAGAIDYYKYHPGKNLVAWHPKSSTLNERTSIGLKTKDNGPILLRQIAGALARRIVCYAKEGTTMKQHEELGFIKFGSRVDMFLPIGTAISVKLDDLVVGGQTVLAKFV